MDNVQKKFDLIMSKRRKNLSQTISMHLGQIIGVAMFDPMKNVRGYFFLKMFCTMTCIMSLSFKKRKKNRYLDPAFFRDKFKKPKKKFF